MNPIELKSLTEETIRSSQPFTWWLFLILLLATAISSFLSAYLRKKGENYATKEDVEIITDKIEKICSQYNEQLEAFKASLHLSNQLKLAALETRLQKHQEAYTHWLELMWSLYDEEKIYPAIIKCQNWWNENCLYLGEESRGAFKTALLLAGEIRRLTDPKDKRQWYDSVADAGKKIVEGVNLPSLGDSETKKAGPESEQNQKSP